MERKTFLDIQFLLAKNGLGYFSSFDSMMYSEVISAYDNLKTFFKEEKNLQDL